MKCLLWSGFVFNSYILYPILLFQASVRLWREPAVVIFPLGFIMALGIPDLEEDLGKKTFDIIVLIDYPSLATSSPAWTSEASIFPSFAISIFIMLFYFKGII
jgi:hypothetical protein